MASDNGGEVVKEIAARHNLKVALGKDLTDKALDHMDQTNESDASFLMKLARQYGAIASVKDGNLLFIRQGQGRTASGKPLPVITITRKAGDGHRFTLADRGAYTGVIASWLHTREPRKKRQPVLSVVERKPPHPKSRKQNRVIIWWERMKTCWFLIVPTPTGTMQSAQQNAVGTSAAWGCFIFLQLAEGRADLYTEMPVKVTGFKQPIDDAEWTITTLTHSVSPDNGFTTSMELEVKIDGLEIE